MKQSFFSNDPHFKPYSYLGLKGRYAHWPSHSTQAKRTFVLIYGQHATLERVLPVAQALQTFGDVYMVDTPGFGGMEPSFKIKRYPDLEFMSGHLEHFITEYIPADRKLTLLGISYGFQIVTAALASRPALATRTEHAMSFVGFVSTKDFDMPFSYTIFLKYLLAYPNRSLVVSKALAFFMKPWFLSIVYLFARPFNVSFKSLPPDEAERYVGEQAWLWRVNDQRTHAVTAWDFWEKVDLAALRIPVDGVHIGVPNDHLLVNSRICAELKDIYKSLEIFDLNLANHAPLDVDSPEKVLALLPDDLQALFASSHNRLAVVE